MLDNQKTYTTYDPDDIRFGIEHLAEQVRTAWGESTRLRFPAAYKNALHIVVAGMGGSGLGPHMLQTAFASRLAVPMTIIHDYTLPHWLDHTTLVLLSSFSGTTEEVLAAAKEAKKRRAKVVVICAGGILAKLAKSEHWPTYVFTPGELAKEPRLGLGFSLAGVLGMLSKLGLVKVHEKDIRRMTSAMGDVLDQCAIDVPEAENPAKTVARALFERQVLMVSAEHLVGNGHVFANQINENGKQFAVPFVIPELNHHLLEGLVHPKAAAKNMTAVLLYSSHYAPRVQKRFAITADMLERMGLQVVDYVTGGADALEECAEVLQFGSFVTYYLGMFNKVNPRAIPFVEEFKKRMAE